MVNFRCYPPLLVMVCLGCGSGEPAIQTANLRYVQMLRTAVSSRKPDQVDQVVEACQRQLQSGAIRPDEVAALTEIAATAREGRWDEAEQACFRLEEGQQWRSR